MVRVVVAAVVRLGATLPQIVSEEMAAAVVRASSRHIGHPIYPARSTGTLEQVAPRVLGLPSMAMARKGETAAPRHLGLGFICRPHLEAEAGVGETMLPQTDVVEVVAAPEALVNKVLLRGPTQVVLGARLV